MIRFKTFLNEETLNEALKTPFPYKWTSRTDHEWHGTSEFNGENGDGLIDIWITYHKKRNPKNPKKPLGRWDITFSVDGEEEITGGGNAFRIFSTVIAAVEDWYKNIRPVPKFIEFVAKQEASRVKLYDKFAKTFSKKIGAELSTLNWRHDGPAVKYVFKINKREIPEMKVTDDDEGGKHLVKTFINEAPKYPLYHKNFTNAVDAAVAYAEKRGYTVDPEELSDALSQAKDSGGGVLTRARPAKNKTTVVAVPVSKNGKKSKSYLQIQIANLDDRRYELNTYV